MTAWIVYLSKLEMPRAVVLLKTLAAYRNLQGRIEFFRCDGIHPTIVSLRIVHKRVPRIRTIQFGHAGAVILQELQVQAHLRLSGKGNESHGPIGFEERDLWARRTVNNLARRSEQHDVGIGVRHLCQVGPRTV